MSGQSFEGALQECLVALDQGERLDFLLLRYPAHAEELRHTLELRGRLAQHTITVPTSMRARGEQRLRATLATPAPRGVGALPRVAVQALLGLAIVSGAVGASAAAGGPNLPAGVLQAVGLMSSDRLDTIDIPAPKSGRPTATPTPTPRGTAASGRELSAAPGTPAADDSGVRGLCAAFLGEGLGQAGRGNPEALSRLLRAAGAESASNDEARSAAISAFCAELQAREAGAGNAAHGPEATPSGAPGAASATPVHTPEPKAQPTPERTPSSKAGGPPPTDRVSPTPPAKGRN